MPKAVILVVDPSAPTRKIYSEYFTHHGYAVVQAADSAEGVRMSASLRPDVVVTELSETPAWLPSFGRAPIDDGGREPVVIACSTLIDASWAQAPAGIDCIVAKPTSLRRLLEEMQRLLARSASARPA